RTYHGTGRGVDQRTPETDKYKHYGVADGLAADWVRCAYRDRQGVLWFGTFNGLSRVRPQAHRPTPPPPTSHQQGGGGWFATFTGWPRLDPQPERTPAPPSISINGLRVAGVKQALAEFGSSEI